jgi:hypothetical protein
MPRPVSSSSRRLRQTVQSHGRCAYDTVAVYEQAAARGARVVVPPTRTVSVSGGKPRCAERDKGIQRVSRVGRRQWKMESGYYRQGTVENAFFRYESMLSDRLHARGLAERTTEVAIGCKIEPAARLWQASFEGQHSLQIVSGGGAAGPFAFAHQPRVRCCVRFYGSRQ